jgi:prolyl oligopeptidase
VSERVETPADATIYLGSADGDGDGWFFYATGFLQPSSLYFVEGRGEPQFIRSLPHFFDEAPYLVEQFHATSSDGTEVPYFVVRRRDAPTDGSTPTLLSAYGGFEVANTPGYLSVDGPLWLDRGGAYVLANIRGGGEFGPRWHRAALRENRQRAFDDLIAVAEDLIDRGLTTPGRLGIAGGSNGGLLVGAAMTQRPDLFGAVVVQVPLLDMRRYHELLAGASWMAEYGDPDDPADWEFIRRYSPYHNVRPDARYPRPLFVTTTRDDRVHPGHARKMAALMESMGHDVAYFENTEGGHGSGVTPEQRALMQAVQTTYLLRQLAGEGL